MKNQDQLEAPQSEAPADAELLTDLLDDLDAITGMIERTRAAVEKGKGEVRLIPRGKARSIESALDELGDALTRRTLQIRAQRAQRDGVIDTALSSALGEVTGEK